MKTTIYRIKKYTIEEFADEHGLEMEVHEREHFNDFYAHFKNCEIKEGSMLCGTAGYGPTPESAIEDYAKKISGKLLVIGAYTGERREYYVPNLITKGNN